MAPRTRKRLTAAQLAASTNETAEQPEQPEEASEQPPQDEAEETEQPEELPVAAAAAPIQAAPEPSELQPPIRNVPRGLSRDDGRKEYVRAAVPSAVELVCLRTWTGVVDGQHRIVRRGAPARDLPQVVIDEMLDRRGMFGHLEPKVTKAQPSGAKMIRATNLGRGNVRLR